MAAGEMWGGEVLTKPPFCSAEHATSNWLCIGQTVAAALLPAAALLRTPPLHPPAAADQVAWTPAAAVSVGVSGVMLLVHAALAVMACVVHRLEEHEILLNCLSMLAWCVMVAADVFSSGRPSLMLRQRLPPLAAVAVYAFESFTSFAAEGQQLQPQPAVWQDPRFWRYSAVWLLGLGFSVSLLVLDTIRVRKTAADAAEGSVREPLLAQGSDVEAPNRQLVPGLPPTVQRRQRTTSWTRLFLRALWYVWPTTISLQLRALISLLLVLVIRGLNLLVPYLYKVLINRMEAVVQATHAHPPVHMSFWEVFYPVVAMYLTALLFQGSNAGGGMGLLNNLRQFLWIPISQAAYRRISLDAFRHALDLDLDYHLHRKTGELIRVMDRGTSSMQNVLSVLVFSLGPQFMDIGAGIVYMLLALEARIALIACLTMAAFIPTTIMLTEWRGALRRQLNLLDNRKSATVTDALLNYETVKYFTNEALEQDNLRAALAKYQGCEFKMLASLNLLNAVQSLIQYLGIAGGLAMCTAAISAGRLTVGDLVLFMSLLSQLYAPLNFFGTSYRVIQQNFIDMENLFDLLTRRSQVTDPPPPPGSSVPPKLLVREGAVEFRNVSFVYDRQLVLDNVSFKVEGGQTVALVGRTGSGKSTLLRLLFRFYDLKSGSILIDGQPINSVTLHTLRSNVGVVPQDSVLFNDTIRHNIRYGRRTATDEEVYEAAHAAGISETIQTRFPLQYDTLVGERGLRLSGGEKQRVAFARAMLKQAPILLLDEATSSLDNLTEKRIQAALAEDASHRTTLVVAHRLSTIQEADQILVLDHGRLIERGSHQELLQAEGHYADLWNRQQDFSSTTSLSEMRGTADNGKGAGANASAN